MEVGYILFAIFIILSTYVLINLTRWFYRRKKKLTLFKTCGIPGPEPSFFSGNYSELKAGPTPNDVVTQWLKQYGDVFGYYIGDIPHLVIKNLDMLKQVTITDFQSFSDRPELFFQAKPLCYTVVALTGKRWKEVRSILTPTFSSGKIKQLLVKMNRKVDIMLEIVAQKAQGEEIFDMHRVAQGLTLDIAADCALAMNVNCQRNPNDPFLLAVRSFILNLNNKVVELIICFPFFARFVTFLSKFITMGKMTSMIVKNLENVINFRRTNPDFRGTDVVQLMLEASGSSKGTATGRNSAFLTDNEIVANAGTFVVAGYESTSTALAFTFYLLIQHPDIQERLYQEIKEKLPDGPPSFDDLQKLHYLDQVLNESLRMYPPITGFITRKCVQECTVGDIVVPEGVVVYAPIWDIHHDPELWPDPWKFDPDRFSAENKAQIPTLSFMPFGVGPRNCIGMRFAQLQAKLAISRLVQNFKFMACEKTDNPLKLVCPSIIINPANGIFLRVASRN